MEYWHGWIPILTDEVLFERAVDDLKKFQVIKNLGKKEFLLLPKADKKVIIKFRRKFDKVFNDKIKGAIRQELRVELAEEVFFYLRNFDDQDTNKLKLVVFSVRDYQIRKVGIFDFPTFEKDKIGIVENLDQNGLIKFYLEFDRAINIYKKESVKHLFSIVRDVYHEHIYAVQTDFALLPVMASDKKTAIVEIFRQYQNKIIDYHKQIKDWLNLLSKRKVTLSSRVFLDASETINDAKGEMIYAQNFITLFSLSNEKLFSVEKALQSFEILAQKIGCIVSIEVNKINFRLFLLTMLFIGVTSYFGLRPFYCILLSCIFSLSIVLIVGSIVILFEWWRNTGKNKKPFL